MISTAQLYQQKILGRGTSADVYQVEDRTGNQLFAQKIFKNQDDFMNERQVLQDLNHNNIIKMICNDNKNQIILELCQNNTLLSYVKSEVRFPETLSRYYFKQLFSCIQYMHQKGYVHRDIKLENILIDQDFNLKLADFGFTAQVKNGKPLTRIVGTNGYFAPEQLLRQEYFGQSSDIFQLGVVLFSLVTGMAPFQNQATQEDPLYKLFIDKKVNRFWTLIETQIKIRLTNEFKDLINKMFAYKVEERITIEEIFYHDWIANTQLQTMSHDEVVAFMSNIYINQD